MTQVVVFDVDGTLVDSVKAIHRCKVLLAKQHGFKAPSLLTVKHVLGMDFKQAMQYCFPDADDGSLHRLMHEFKQLMRQKDFESELFPGTKAMLVTLRVSGMKLAIATSKSRQELDQLLGRLALHHYFELTCCAEEYRSKPDPSMLHHICSQLAILSQDAVMVGDTCHDILFAKNANMPMIAVSFGAHSREQLQQHLQDDAIIDNWPALLERINLPCNNRSVTHSRL